MDQSSSPKVLQLRSESSGPDKYADILHANGYDVFSVPTLEFTYQNLDSLLEHLSSPSSFAGIIFTSPRAVMATCEAMESHKLEWSDKMCFVVGERTGSLVAEKLGLSHIGSESGDASSLSDVIIAQMAGNGLPLLFPCGNLKKETLPKKLEEAGIKLSSCTVYATQEHPNLSKKLEEYLALRPDFAVYFSPSGVNFSQKIMKHAGCHDMKHVSIGPSTREALERNGMSVFASAAKPCPEAVLQAIKGM